MSIKDQLFDQLSRTSDIPFLFVGSGMSRRYMGLETWADLLRRFAEKTGAAFEYYLTKADGDFPRLASILAEDFHSVWWRSDEYAESRESFRSIVKRRDSPLKVAIAEYIESMSERSVPDEYQHEVDALSHVTVDGIITTNWDMFLENVFPEYESYVGQDQLLFSQPQTIAEIYKIHGSCAEPESLVLTEEDYKRFQERNPYLAAKLLTVFVEHPVVFLGYSLSDPHIRRLLEAIANCLTAERLNDLSGRLVFVEFDRDGRGDSIGRNIFKNLPLTEVRTRDFSQIYDVLAAKQRAIPAKVLRQVKEHLYELVRTNDPKAERYVQSFEEVVAGDKAPEVYAGLGPIKSGTGDLGYRTIKTDDIIQDVLFDDTGFQAAPLLEFTLPSLLRGNVKWVPIFKYLDRTERIQDGGIMTEGLTARVIERAVRVSQKDYYPPGPYYIKKRPLVRKLGSLAELLAQYDAEHCLIYGAFLRREAVDPDQLRALLCAQYDAMRAGSTDHTRKTHLARMVCFYDWLVYAPQVPPSG